MAKRARQGRPPILSPAQALEARERYASEDVTPAVLAADFGVSAATMRRILRGTSHASAPMPPSIVPDPPVHVPVAAAKRASSTIEAQMQAQLQADMRRMRQKEAAEHTRVQKAYPKVPKKHQSATPAKPPAPRNRGVEVPPRNEAPETVPQPPTPDAPQGQQLAARFGGVLPSRNSARDILRGIGRKR